jgi:hypothetical protein
MGVAFSFVGGLGLLFFFFGFFFFGINLSSKTRNRLTSGLQIRMHSNSDARSVQASVGLSADSTKTQETLADLYERS